VSLGFEGGGSIKTYIQEDHKRVAKIKTGKCKRKRNDLGERKEGQTANLKVDLFDERVQPHCTRRGKKGRRMKRQE